MEEGVTIYKWIEANGDARGAEDLDGGNGIFIHETKLESAR